MLESPEFRCLSKVLISEFGPQKRSKVERSTVVEVPTSESSRGSDLSLDLRRQVFLGGVPMGFTEVDGVDFFSTVYLY